MDGSNTDVAEIDAASNSGVDNIRDLREELIYTPVASKMRVYIIDEVHMLSTGAFNALLKTLEEPPPHVLFILATTETHKIPATISSRCQRFAFRRIPVSDLEARLRYICEQEHVSIEQPALSLLAHMADGSHRDGQSLLEQCITAAAGESVTEATVREALGLFALSEAAQWLLEIHDLKRSIERLEALYQSGLDFSVILGQLSSLLRDILMGQMLEDLAAAKLPAKLVTQVSELWPRERILWALSHLQESQNRLSRSSDKRLEAQMCLIRLSSPELTAKPAAPPPTPPLPKVAPPAPPPNPKPNPQQEEPVSLNPEPVPSPASRRGDSSAEGLAHDPRWAKLLAALNPLLREVFSKTDALVENDRLIVQSSDPYAKGLLRQAEPQVAALFAGGLVFPDDQPVSGIDALRQSAGELFIEE